MHDMHEKCIKLFAKKLLEQTIETWKLLVCFVYQCGPWAEGADGRIIWLADRATSHESRLRWYSWGVNPYEKSCDFYKLFCVHSYSTREAKVDKGVHLFF